MLIECSFCHATAKLPDDKEGAKVRCPACSKVYVAHEKGVKRGRGGPNTLVLSMVGAAVLAAIVIGVMTNNRKPPMPQPAPPVAVKPPDPVIDTIGWDSEVVRTVRGLYDA